jgi:hypothetical protein
VVTGHRHRLARAATVLVVALLGAACAGSGYHYVKNSDDRTYFKVPDAWKLYDEDQVLKVYAKDMSPRQRSAERDSSWQVVFDASPKPSLSHLGSPKAKHPNGIAVVRELSFDDADTLSLGSLRNLFYDVDTAVQSQKGEVVKYEPLELDGGFHGFHMVAEVDSEKGNVVTLDQTTLVDQATSKVYTLLVTCDSRCYDHNSDQIDRVVKSWTVRS